MEKEIQEQLEQKKKDLMLFCMANKIPMFSAFAEETVKGTEYNSVVVTPYELSMKLTEDKITKFSAALNRHFEIRFKTFAKTEDEFDSAIDDLLED